MASLQCRSIIVIDDEDVVEVDDNLTILDHESSFPTTSLQATKPTSAPPSLSRQDTLAGQQITIHQDKRLASKPLKASIISPFRSPVWTPRTPRSRNVAPISPPMSGQTSRERSRTLSLSPTAESPIPKSMLGTANEPIDLLADDNGEGAERNLSERRITKDQFGSNASYSLVPKNGAWQHQQYILLDDDDKDEDELSNALARSLRRLPTADDELIDLEDIEDDLLQADDQVLQIEDAYLGDERQQESRRSSRAVKIEPRNPVIVLPSIRKESLKHLGSTLRANKTVELRDGSFLRIKDIIINAETDEVKLRGHRIQRTRDMNGMLPKKMNECLLFLEVDIDDHRDPLGQAVVEIPLAEVVQLRSVRYTNEKFPRNRNIDPKGFVNKELALETGGLTARWRYTCQYGSAISRYHNSFKERSLEHLTLEECTKGCYSSDVARRYEWRGETVPGGGYRPTIDREQSIFLADSREGGRISIQTSEETDGFALVHVYSINDTSSDEGEDHESSAKAGGSRLNLTKRKRSEVATWPLGPGSSRERRPKKARHMEEKSVKETREGMLKMSLQPDEKRGSKTYSKVIDLSSSLPGSIDLTLSDLATPPNTGSIRSKSGTPPVLVKRTAGQKLTYGDSFCGAGGATRGAVMAGLRVLWGFDFWKQACETWETNFPDARCFHKAAHEFVEFAKRYPHLVKIDVLHLSPPCQFFSPAHTINGVDDEMNTASLFAVQAVIEVAKARIVTLEQTFGITHPRFRFYFNALIQMFTAHDFSVRWAVVPLAQWGLPQRRMRLIIIASCPGEILPKMPAATHSESCGGIPPLKPFNSVQSALSTIPRPNALRPDPLHDPDAMAFARNKCLPPWDASKILPRAMTTSGGGNWHPFGKRDFTPREYATLQGFPQGHIFKGSYVKKQIGNAFPPCVAKVLFESIKEDLDEADGVKDDAELIE